MPARGMQEISAKGLEMSAMTNPAKMGDHAQSVGLKPKTTPVNAGQGFIGRDCEVSQDDCASRPCSNGGTCLDGQAQFTCMCTDAFTGIQGEFSHFCQINLFCISFVGKEIYICEPAIKGKWFM